MKRLPVAGCLLPAALLLAMCATKPAAPAPVTATPAADPQVATLQASMTELLERLDVMNDRITKLERASEERAQARTSGTPASSPAAPASVPHSEGGGAPRSRGVAPLKAADVATRYRDAMLLHGQGRFAEARVAFQQVFDADPSGELADNALFWIGETYYASGDTNDAIRFFKRVVDEYGDQNKAPDAMYMLALAYEKTSDLALARTTLQQVIARYPYSAPAASAKSELNRIKY